MPRPFRIEYENAFYHVINRGRERQNIFYGEVYFRPFLDTLAEAHQRLGFEIHSYCLISKPYHLLIESPNANFSRVMTHINGVYTQRYNRLKRMGGPLFRRRYKRILDGQDEYLLQLSPYIHTNPIETTIPMVERLEDSPCPSSPAFVGLRESEGWLNVVLTYQLPKHPNPLRVIVIMLCEVLMNKANAFTQKAIWARYSVIKHSNCGFSTN